MNLFLVETPHQLINAIEAKESLGLRNNCLMVMVLDEYPVEAYSPMISPGDWDAVRYESFREEAQSPLSRYLKNNPVQRIRGYYDTWETYGLRKRLDQLAASLGAVDKLFLGNYYRDHMRHFGHVLKHNYLYLLDDGTATLFINEERRKELAGKKPKDINQWKADLISRIIGMKTTQAEKVTYFSTYEFETVNLDRVIKNNYTFFRNKVKTGKTIDEVFFLGMTLYDEGFTDELYLEQLRRVKEYFKDENMVYLPHKGEPAYRVERAQKELGLTVRRYDVPIEYQLAVRGTIPKVLASFFCSALENCRIIFGPHLKIKAIYIEPELFPLRPDFVKNVYDYFLSKAGPNFQIVRLQG